MARDPNPQRIWLTGATSGIGEALARRLLDDGHRVALTSRGKAGLERLAKDHENAMPVPADITDRASMQDAAARIDEAFDGLDMVIFNAGTCVYLDGGRVDTTLVRDNFEPNFFGTIHGIEVALPLLHKARRQGARPQIVATSSASAYLALPRAEAYGASKAALSYFLESLRLDLAHQGIDVSVIHPGFVKTPLTERNDFPMPMAVTPEQAAKAIFEGLSARRRDIHFPRRFTYLVKFMGILPLRLRIALGKRLVRREDDDASTPHKEPNQ